MRNNIKQMVVFLLVIYIFGLTGTITGRAMFVGDSTNANQEVFQRTSVNEPPNRQFAAHDIGKIAMTITNFGNFGIANNGFVCDGELCPSCEYPINSNIEYLYMGAIWIGAVVGRDTLVSVGADGWFPGITEILPDGGTDGIIITRSNLQSRPDYHEDAISEQDFLCSFADTVIRPGETGTDQFDNRPHIPLNVTVQQNTYAWSYDYAEDFVLFDYKITNIGIYPIRDMYMAIYVDADVLHQSVDATGFQDDICGFRRTVPMPDDYCIDEDTINIAWIADNDGDPVSGNWSFTSPVAVTGTRVVRSPTEDLSYSFNWWISNMNASLDFGPRRAGTDTNPFRSFNAHLGTPTGDRNKYYVMSSGEFDYDQLESAISHTNAGYLGPPRPDMATDFANGYDTRYLLSFGPFDVQPGDTLPITLAYIAGDNFHRKDGADDFSDYFDAMNPNAFYQKLDFSDFGLNARWASWIYDNPGYDTDGDGDSGKFCWNFIWADTTEENPADSFVIDSNKTYYAGDGVPDFRGAAPPPPPELKVMSDFGKVTLRWNGQISENTFDVFSNEKDFEGYRVYYSESDRASEFVLLSSFDLDDYKLYEFIQLFDTVYWDQVSVPLTHSALREKYGQSFNANDYYDEFHSYEDPFTGKLYYFVPQDWNQSDLTDPLLIHKVYPTAAKDDSSDTTDDGWLRYYEYEYEIPNLLPSRPYYFSVTAFDYGSLKADLGVLESSPLVNAVQDFALPSSETVEEKGLSVLVYPNPYRIDGGYASAGYENRDRRRSAERSREIHFSNLPKVCTIRIFSITGDLIKQIDHNYPNGGAGSQHEVWSVISRNTQAVVTGIYLWHVESDMGEQLGKLVIMK
jgi:hypothetical protein